MEAKFRATTLERVDQPIRELARVISSSSVVLVLLLEAAGAVVHYFPALHFERSLFVSWYNNIDTETALTLVNKLWSLSPHDGLPYQQY